MRTMRNGLKAVVGGVAVLTWGCVALVGQRAGEAAVAAEGRDRVVDGISQAGVVQQPVAEPAGSGVASVPTPPVQTFQPLVPTPAEGWTGATFLGGPPVTFSPEVTAARLNVEFDHAPLGEIIAWLRNRPVFHEVNFVLSQGVRFWEYTADPITIKLRSVSLPDILAAIEIATDNAVAFEVRTPTLVAVRSRVAAPAPEAVSRPQYRVVNLRQMLRLAETDAIEEVIETVNQLVVQTLNTMEPGAGERLRPKFNYHDGSGVLVMVGQQEALRIAEQILSNLRGASAPPLPRAASPNPVP